MLRALQRVRPDIYRERHRVFQAIRQHRHTLAQLDSILCERLGTGDDAKAIDNSTKFLSDVVELKSKVTNYMLHMQISPAITYCSRAWFMRLCDNASLLGKYGMS